MLKKGAINNVNYKSQGATGEDDDSIKTSIYIIGLESQGYGFLIKDMKKCLDKKKKKLEDEEETFADNFKLSPQYAYILIYNLDSCR